MRAAEITVSGGEQIEALLKALPHEYAKRGLQEAFKAGAQMVADEARLQAQAQGIDVFDDRQESYRDARRKTTRKGQFWENIIVARPNRRSFLGKETVFVVAVRKGFSQLAHLFEYGTGPRRRKNGGRTGSVAARPFLRPALDIKGPAATEEIARRTRENFTVLVAQLRRRIAKPSLSKRARRDFG